MSDEPSDAQKLIAEVLKPLIYADMRYPDELFAQRRAEAYAAEVDKALGGLTQKWAAHYIGDGELVTECAKWQALRCAAAQPQTVRAEFYFVSGWTVTE
ncbi:hypothetical protein [Mycobacteroides abscessus]|uniref:hypothetical protein n=1 Tax=Mycobacteroides abscessus TaxID=36809 RepID=UPI0002D85D64|nr:hypothetical protein [Mycobacteroides abscessus]